MNDENQHEKTAVPLDQTSVSNVTVFVSDRAEITRLISVQGLRPGVQEITVMGLTSKADEDSIRVKAAPGCRRSKLLEVSFEVHTKADEAGEGGRSAIDAKRSELKELQAKLTETLDALGREVANKELIDTYVRGMLAPYRDSKLTQPPPVGEKLSSVRELLAFHASAAAEHSAARLRLEVEVAALRAKVEAVEEALRRLFAPARPRTKSSRDVHVLVDVETAAGVAAKGGDAAGEPPLLLLLTYMVSSASWVPSYDIRVETCQGSEPDMSITYLGLVSNASGEDWPACRLRLSTAQPSKGGMPAAPPRRRVGWQEEAFGGGGHFGPPGCPPRGREAHMRRGACGAAPMQPPMQAYMAYPNAMLERELSVDALEVMDAMDGSGEMAATASVSDSAGGAATFSVERPCTIESDARPHRVTIAILSFKPTLLFFATPLLEEAAYMQVRARNASSFPLLASRKVACFLDGSFVCTTHLKDVMPSEEFTTFVGTDPSLKLEHVALAKEHRAPQGWGSRVQSTAHRYRTKVTNTKAQPVHLTLVEVLPKATEDKIKVELISPAKSEIVGASTGVDADAAQDGTDGKDRVLQNKVTNNVVWQLKLEPGEKREIHFEYTITWPADKSISEFNA